MFTTQERQGYRRIYLWQMWITNQIEWGAITRFSPGDPVWADGWGTSIGSIDWAVSQLGG